MTSEIRQTPEVLFARNVARACRMGNFIAFFRLARKATYLQACLMHAHFAKLRTQALASLHSGLQNNQGVPVAHVANWLAMEDEGIEDLLEYHGFLLKTFEEPYMVKEGPFLNVDVDYPTKCSELVHKKRSRRIIEDVSPSIQAESPHVETMKEIQRRKTHKHEPQVVLAVKNDSFVQKLGEEIPDSEPIFSPKHSKSGKAFKDVQDSQKDHNMSSTSPSPLSFPFPNIIPEPQLTRIDVLKSTNLKSTNSDLVARGSPERNLQSNVDPRPLEIVPKAARPESSFGISFSVPLPVAQGVYKDESLIIHQEHEDEITEVRENCQDEEIAEAKLKLFLRLWRRRASKLRMLREERQLASNAALASMPLGPPIKHYKNQPGNFNKFDIDMAMRERYKKREKSWSRLNVSDIVAGTLGRRNPDAKCLCWKIILCSQMNSGYEMGAAGLWLTSKFMPSSDEDAVISSPGLVIWRKWISSQAGINPTCCLSVVRDTAFGSLDEAVSGAGAGFVSCI
ncbi:Germinal-center associated nuclear protein [Spatholobus suberectus]|nr:Germinal-center associated nuclear protein [Spatholobus suberectus]